MIDRAIIDTPIWIGAHWNRDQWWQQSNEILDALRGGKIRTAHVTDYVMVETVNFLLRKGNPEIAQQALDTFMSKRVRICYVDALLFAKIQRIFAQHPGLSLTDCSLIALAEELDLKAIFSFDRGFDRVEGIERREEFKE